jgi:antitoxin component of MazEF toxin-antitoxin module
MKISKDGNSYKVLLPKKLVEELGWKHHDKLKAVKWGKGMKLVKE